MSRIEFDKTGERFYETGVKNCVLFPKTGANGTYGKGVAWNGIISISENPSGAEANPLYADDMKYLNLVSAEEFSATIEAYTYPDEFGVCDGSVAVMTAGESPVDTGIRITQQPRKEFGLCYRTTIGNDETSEYGEKLHFVYNGLASPSEKGYQTINDSPEAITFSWEMSTTPVKVKGYKPTAHVEVDLSKLSDTKKTALENLVYGTDATTDVEATDPTLPTPDEIITLITAAG